MKDAETLSDGGRPDGLTLIPWQYGKPLTWDVTVATMLADSYTNASASSAGAAAEMAVTRKTAKYADLPASYTFQPVALETLGPINVSAAEFLVDLGRRIAVVSGEEREGQFPFQRFCVTMLRCNSVMLHDSFIREDDPDLYSHSRQFILTFF